MLSDLGAEVIKVEQPGIGDYQRDLPPKNVRDFGEFPAVQSQQAQHHAQTSNSRTGWRRHAVWRLGADVLIEGFRPGVMTRLGLGYDAVAALNPRLVYCSLTGFGQDGPYRDLPGHDMNDCIVGAMQLLSRAATGPLVPGPLIADIGGGSLMAVFGILAALIGRGVTGRGQHVDVSMTDGMMAWMAPHAGEWLFAGREPRGGEYFNAWCGVVRLYRCADGRFITLGIIERHFWDRLKSLLQNNRPAGRPAGRRRGGGTRARHASGHL